MKQREGDRGRWQKERKEGRCMAGSGEGRRRGILRGAVARESGVAATRESGGGQRRGSSSRALYVRCCCASVRRKRDRGVVGLYVHVGWVDSWCVRCVVVVGCPATSSIQGTLVPANRNT